MACLVSCCLNALFKTRLSFDITRSIQVCSVGSYKNPPDYSNVQFPPWENRKLPLLPRMPPAVNLGQKVRRGPKKLIDMRGPELVHNKLIHQQFGVQALMGGRLRHGHIESSRLKINRKMDTNRMFAVWRIAPPWKPVTKKGLGTRMGGGKGAINHYVTPIKANRIIMEMGGKVSWDDVHWMLKIVAHNLPFPARVVSQEMLDQEEQERQKLIKENINLFTFEYVAGNEMFGGQAYLSPYDYLWYNEHR